MSRDGIAQETNHMDFHYQRVSEQGRKRKMNRVKCLAGVLLITITVSVGVSVTVPLVLRAGADHGQVPANNSGWYAHAAVAADAPICSTVGTSILKKGGSAVDGAVATQICQGVVNFQASGLGGGGFMVIYNRSTGTAEAINFRESAPQNAFETMLLQKDSRPTLTTGVPGELRAMHMAWTKYGKLPWSDLFQPSIELAQNGFAVTKGLFMSIDGDKELILKDPFAASLRELLAPNGDFPVEGDTIKRPVLANTLKLIAEQGPDVIYNGSLTSQLVKELNDAGANFTEADFNNYSAESVEPLRGTFRNMTVFSMPPPSSGAVLQLIIGILDLYNMTPKDFGLLSYQRTIEAFKFAYGQRTHLADPTFVSTVQRQVEFMMDPKTAEKMKSMIRDNQTFPPSYYNITYPLPHESGTCHFSVLDQEGNAVALTTTINTGFGSLVRSNSTGIIFNDELLDFSTPNHTDIWGLPPNPINFIKPGKRPQSSTSPTILVDSSGQVMMVTGASGGTRITSTVGLITSGYFVFKEGLKNATDMKRVHHQLLPDVIFMEPGFPEDITMGLEKIGHRVNYTATVDHYFSAAQSIVRDVDRGLLNAVCDNRKGGAPDGF